MAATSSKDPVATAVFIIAMFLILAIIAGASNAAGKFLATLVGVFVLVALISPDSGLMTDIKSLKAKL